MSLRSRWLDLFCEEWRKPDGEVCEYWRVEKADSLIVVPIVNDGILLSAPEFRPGAGKCTWDLPGGRILPGERANLDKAVASIVSRELALDPASVQHVDWIDASGTLINSSFNSQRLFLARAELSASLAVPPNLRFHPLKDLAILLQEIECMQCSYALLRLMHTYRR